jgi:hypothetical protein
MPKKQEEPTAEVKPAAKAPAQPVKKRPRVVTNNAPTVAHRRGSMLRESLTVARKEFADKNICVASEANKIVVGIPLPSLALEYLIQNTVWPLGRFMQIVGKTGTCKSALCFEMARWFQNSQGVTYLFENESRYSPDYALSIMGYPKNQDDESLSHLPCKSVDDWQSKLQRMVKYCQDQMNKKEIGRQFPVLYIVDSLMGKLSLESQATIDKKGSADRAFPHEALMINSFLKKIPQDLEEWPMCLVATNHLKPQKNAQGITERHKSGGATPDFQETFEIEMSRDAGAKIKQVDEESFEQGGLKLVLTCKKNSLGETDRNIHAPIRWIHREDPDTGEWRQYTRWDWPAATVAMLASFEKGHRADKIKEIVDIGGNGNRWHSKTFGVTSTEPVSASELGRMIEGDEKIKGELRKLFGIKERKIFQPGVDYLKQLSEVRVRAEREMVK